MSLYIPFSWILLVLGALFEFRRVRKLGTGDTFSAIALTFAAIFVVAPSILYWSSPDDPAFVGFVWMRHLPENEQTYVLAGVLVAVSFLSVYWGYRSSRAPQRAANDCRVRPYLIAGLVLTAAGLIAFFTFLEIVGGPSKAFQTAFYLRLGVPENLPLAKFAFVKRLSFFVLPGSVFLLQAASRRASLWPIAAFGVCSALFILTFMYGRVQLATYIAPLLVAMWPLRYRVQPKLALAGVLWICMIFGVVAGTKMLLQPRTVVEVTPVSVLKELEKLKRHPPSVSAASPEQAPEPAQDAAPSVVPPAARPDAPPLARAPLVVPPAAQPGAPPLALEPVRQPFYLSPKVVGVGLEFAFPFCNLLSVLTTDPPRRWFIDLVLPFFHLLPKRIIPVLDYLPPRLDTLNKSAQIGSVSWGIPVDLITFGYFSLGTLGVLIASVGFGWLARRIELMMPRGNYGDDVFRFMWMFLIATLVMYGDPNWLVLEQFHWLVGLGVYLMLTRANPASATSRELRAT
jgi:hypothetical protein